MTDTMYETSSKRFLMRLIRQGLLVPFVLTILSSFYALGQEVKTDTASGLYVTILETPKGKIKVYLPDGLASGDTISATVILEPKGKTEDEKSRNRKDLSEYSLELEKEKKPTFKRTLKWTIPPGLTGGVTYIIIRNKNGKELARAVVPIRTAPVTERPVNPNAWEYECPIIGRAGEATQIKGPFDGDFDTTDLKVGGKEVNLIAESPRRLVFESPSDVIGHTQIELKEGNVVVKRRFNNLRLVKINVEKKRFLTSSEKPTKAKTSEETTKTSVQQTPPPLKQEEVKAKPKVAEIKEQIPTPSHTKRVEASQMNFSLAPKYVQMPAPTRLEIKQGTLKTKEEGVPPVPPGQKTKMGIEEKEPIKVETKKGENTPTDTAFVTPVEMYGIYTVQVASFKRESDAEDFAEELKLRGYPAFVKQAEVPGRGTWHRVRIGTFKTIEEAKLFGYDLRRQERGIQSFFITVNN